MSEIWNRLYLNVKKNNSNNNKFISTIINRGSKCKIEKNKIKIAQYDLFFRPKKTTTTNIFHLIVCF